MSLLDVRWPHPDRATVETNSAPRRDMLGGVVAADGGTWPVQNGAIWFRLREDHRRGVAVVDRERVLVRLGDIEYAAPVRPALDAHERPDARAIGSDVITAPMPGVVAEVKVKLGDAVEAGTPVLVLESMKLFQTLAAPRAGRVAHVHVSAGQSVAAGLELIALEPEHADWPTATEAPE